MRALVLSLAAAPALLAAQTSVRILHANDTHAHIEPTMVQGKPYGGWAKFATAVRQNWDDEGPCFLLHGGDAFQGTLYFNVYEGLADVAIMNRLGFDAMAVGNHEFDLGPGALARFASLAQFPCLAANLDLRDEAQLRELVRPSAVIESKGVRIGVVGACTEDLPEISSPGPNVKLFPIVPALQAEVDKLTAQGIQIIVVLSHCGYDVERGYARSLRGVDVVVGGHSHSLLGDVPLPGNAVRRGDYPTVEKNADGDTVLVVQAWEWAKVMGRLDVQFDSAGKVVGWEGSAPVLVDGSLADDPEIAAMTAAFRKPIEALMSRPVGEASVALERSTRSGESPLGNMIADAMLDATRAQGAVAAFMNAGGVRATIEAGVVTYGKAAEVQPFSNTLVLLELTGAQIVEALENGAKRFGFLAVSEGTSYRVDRSSAEGSRVSGVVIAGAPVDPAKTYRVTFNNFNANGGDGQGVLKDAKGFRRDTGLIDLDALIAYLAKNSPVRAAPTGRVRASGG
jgi:5'-nucleotidase